ncbi:MAG: tetratricopeptide repeat protein [Armatimonadetes bacterium]|nr:tetratricopeptide repeat protein [Armatimonadota bacterium]
MEAVRQALTLLMTDVEGSTALWEAEPGPASQAISRHDEIVESVVVAHGGEVLKKRGEGDSAFCVFKIEEDAVAASAALQRELASENWPTSKPIRVRIALHRGEVEDRDGDYYGATVNRCARLRAVAHGGQVVVSQAVHACVSGKHSFRDHGLHRLKDLLHPEHIYELVCSEEEFPSLRSLNALDHNLPIQLTAFIGRKQELREVEEALSASRLVTMIGVGGCGKTRLALQAGAHVAGYSTQVVRFVSFADLPRSSDVSGVVARGVGVDAPDQTDPIDAVVEAFDKREALFIFDNCEHVLDSAAAVARRLLMECPGVKILATSREILGLSGERTFITNPLALPPETEQNPVQVLRHESAALFIDRVRQRRADFVLDSGSAPVVVRLVRALDGIPLAIEQAAARAGTIGLDAIVERLGKKLDLLRSTQRDVEPRQRTVRATLEWSHGLLDDAEREIFARISAFQGVFTTADASVVCGRDALEEMESLVQKCVVTAVHSSSHAMGYRLVETVKEFGRERIEEDAPDAFERHLEWALDLAEWIDETIEGQSSAEAFQVLERAYEDLVAALRRSIDALDGRAVPLAFALRKPWLRRGPTTEGVELIGRAIFDVGHSDEKLVANAHNALGAMAMNVGQTEKALENLGMAAERFGELGLPTNAAASIANMGILHALKGDFEKAKPLFEASLDAYRSGGDTVGAAKVALNFGRMLADSGHDDDAVPFLETALATFQGSDPVREALALVNLADVLPEGEPVRRLGYLERSFRILTESPDHSQMSIGLTQLARIAVDCRQFTDAATLLAAAEHCLDQTEAEPSKSLVESYEELHRLIGYEVPHEAVGAANTRARSMNDTARMTYATELACDFRQYLDARK